MDNIFINTSHEQTSSSEEEYDKEPETFMNMTKMSEYEKNRNRLFNRDIIKKNIVIDSHNYFQGDDGDGEKFNTSNFTVLFDLEDEPTESYQEKITTNYDIFKNVIGFRLLKTTIRTPPYNVNSTNNVIKYKRSGLFKKNPPDELRDPEEILTITINPGVYTTEDLAGVFQKFEGYYDQEDSNPESRTDISKKNAHFVTYSDPDAGLSGMTQNEIDNITEEQKVWGPWIPTTDIVDALRISTKGITDNTLKVTFLETNYRSSNTRSLNYPYDGPIKSNTDSAAGVKFLFEFDYFYIQKFAYMIGVYLD